MRQQLQVIVVFVLNLLLLQSAFANNVLVSDIKLTGQDATNHNTFIQFDVTWENSWRNSINWDAAWVFVKYSTDGGSTWSHATLDTIGHTAPSGATIDSPSDGKGVFIYRSSNGSGTVNFSAVQLRWGYGTDGVADNALVKVKVFAIEMVLVPTASFYLGDGTISLIRGQLHDASSTTTPFHVMSEGAITLGGTTPGNLGNNDAVGVSGAIPDDFNSITTQILPENFPKGYHAFYCMKYEISQEQYADFLNTLTNFQAASRMRQIPDLVTNRNGIMGSHPDFFSSRPFVACNFLQWVDGCAYADWAGLRPMTELEFEKACRGDQIPVANEFAWGDTSITPATGIDNDGEANEIPSNAGANCAVDNQAGVQGPLRVGSFATSSSSRAEAGASYYGIMELTGNVWERTVTIANVWGRNFTGTMGDGSLSPDGNATNSDWPGFDIERGDVRRDIQGSGFRGGCWQQPSSEARVSDRLDAADESEGGNPFSQHGFRGVRQAP